MLCWHQAVDSNEMTSLSISLADGISRHWDFFLKMAHASLFLQYVPRCSRSLSKIYGCVFEVFFILRNIVISSATKDRARLISNEIWSLAFMPKACECSIASWEGMHKRDKPSPLFDFLRSSPLYLLAFFPIKEPGRRLCGQATGE